MKWIATLLFVAAGCTPVQSSADEYLRLENPYAGRSPADVAAAVIRARDVAGRVEYLASDAMRGRDTPSPELEEAAQYLAAELEGVGLEPGADDGYVQYWPFRRRVLDRDQASLTFTVGDARIDLRYGTDYVVVGGGDAIQAEAVLVGHVSGAASAMAATVGRVAVVFLGGARPEEWPWPVIGRTATAAARAEAGAVVFVLDPALEAGALDEVMGAFELPMQEGLRVPLFFVTHHVGREVFGAGGLDLERMWIGEPPARTLPGVVAAADAPMREVDVEVPNVVALLPGSDPDRSEEYVILSAHYDHVGVGPPDASGDSIYNGADDNASGTAALLEVAEAFAALAERPARPVLFLAVAGEEKGLLGSQWFAANPTVYLTDAVANLNLDMIGRNEPGEVVIVGRDYSTLGPLVDSLAAAHAELGLSLIPDPNPGESFFTRSDQYNFAVRGIPAVLVTTHLHEDYHSPADEADRLDADKVARIARLVFLAALEVAQRETAPTWTEAGRQAIRTR